MSARQVWAQGTHPSSKRRQEFEDMGETEVTHKEGPENLGLKDVFEMDTVEYVHKFERK